jgi:hypothetical protein
MKLYSIDGKMIQQIIIFWISFGRKFQGFKCDILLWYKRATVGTVSTVTSAFLC